MHGRIRKRIGIITGSGPYAGIDLWKKILEQYKCALGDKFNGDVDYPEVLILSLPNLGLSMQLDKYTDVVWESLKAAIAQLDKKVEVFIIACNTLHYYYQQILSLRISAKFLSINEILENYLKLHNTNEFALLGINTVSVQNKYFPYSNLLKNYKLEKLDKYTITTLHNLSLQIKKNGVKSYMEQEMLNIIQKINSPICILACTEFPLLKLPTIEKEIVDLNLLLARAVVDDVVNQSPSMSIGIPQLDMVGK